MKSSGIPKAVEELIRYFDRMPGIGPKSAARLAFYWLRVPRGETQGFADTLLALKDQVKRCKTCFNLSTEEECELCQSRDRNHGLICVVEDALDLLAIERAGKYDGVYHVLEGVISPLNRVDPEDLTITALIERVKELAKGKKGEDGFVVEVLIATNPTMEGEATAMYIRDLLKKVSGVKLSRLAQGLPSGADLEYADQLTIGRALEARSEYE